MNLLEACRTTLHSRLVFQDELSSHFDIQLALLPEDWVTKAQVVFEDFFLPEELKEVRSLIAKGDFFSKDMLEKYRQILIERSDYIDESILLDFSGESPVLQIIRTNHHFRILEALFVAYAISDSDEPQSTDVQELSFPSSDSSCLTMRIAYNPTWRGYIVTGPAFISQPSESARDRINKERVAPLVDAVQVFLEDHELERLWRYGPLRSAISLSDSNKRIAKIHALLSVFESVEMDQYIYEASILAEIAKLVVEFFLVAADLNCKVPNEAQLIEVIPLYTSTRGENPQLAAEHLSLELRTEDLSIVGRCSLIAGTLDGAKGNTDLGSELSQVADRSHTNQIDQRLENLLVFRGWVFDYMGDAEPTVSGDQSAHRFGRLKDFLIGEGGIVQAIACSWIWKILRCDIVTYYKLDHDGHELNAEAFYANGSTNISWAKSHAEFVEKLGKEENVGTSYLYEVCQTGQGIMSSQGREVHSGEDTLPTMEHLDAASLETPNSFFILPVKHGQRIIGVIECISFRPFAYSDNSVILIDDFSELLGKYFIAQANAALVDEVRSSMSPTKWTKPSGSRFDELAAAVARYFVVHSASIWLIDPFDRKRLTLDGSINRPKPEKQNLKGKAKQDIRLDDRTAVTSHTAESGRWEFGTLGVGKFGKRWQNRPERECLESAGLKYIAIIPVLGGGRRPLASITLLSKLAPFSEDLRPQAEFCARVLATALTDMALVERVLIDGLSETSHEIRNIARHLRNAGKKLQEQYNEIRPVVAGEDEEAPYDPYQIYLDDITAFSNDLNIINNVMEPASFLKLYSDPNFRGSPLVRQLISKINIRPTELRGLWNREFETFSEDIKNRRLDVKVKWFEGKVKVPIDKHATATILRNILGNAVKYSPRGAKVHVRIHENTSRKNFILSVSNYGPKLEPEEEDRIFYRKFQGHRAKEMNDEGRGEGLYQAFALMVAQKGELKHHQDEDDTLNEYVMHQFSLTFPY